MSSVLLVLLDPEYLKLELTFYLYLVIFPDLMENEASQVHERARVTLATVTNQFTYTDLILSIEKPLVHVVIRDTITTATGFQAA